MTRSVGRTSTCSRTDARNRFATAEKFYEVAELVALEADDQESSSSVAAALAVLAGIAASDAACCAALGRRPRGQDHRQAASLLKDVQPGGAAASAMLAKLLDLKDGAHYGLIFISAPELKTAMRQASKLVEFARGVLLP